MGNHSIVLKNLSILIISLKDSNSLSHEKWIIEGTPIIFSRGTNPQNLLSKLLSLLSPKQNTY